MKIDDRELELLITEIYEYYGYDFSGYARASLKRRIERLMALDHFSTFSMFVSKIRNDETYMRRLVEEITVNITEMFRDPHFYEVVRKEILPILATKPFIRLWHAGCSTGEEVFSFAILLKEANLLHKSILYATDISPRVLQAAKSGVFPLKSMKQFSENYRESGGRQDFSDYYTANYGYAKFSDELLEKMVFSQHNLVADSSFNEFNMIICRNVMIYFDKDLQERALKLFDDSLESLGFIALGSKETMKFSPISNRYQQWNKEKLWKKIK